ncbi:MAG: hypothetical protein WDM87_04720 [Terracidiphilus sp.]
MWGPAGGDARAFAAFPGQPKHLLLGTTNSWLYETTDEGANWHRLAKLGSDDGLVLDSIVVNSADPATIYVGAWKNSDEGGLWVSHDSGRSWSEPAQFKGQPIHALAQAPSDAHILYAGEHSKVFSGRMTAERRGRRSARRAATKFTRLNRWRSIPAMPTWFTREHGTCRGRRLTAARHGTTSSRD